ncbi:MAG: flagellar export chaperone FlgN [Phycisphaerae bacterium]
MESTATQAKLVRDLVRLFEGLQRIQQRLHQLLQEKMQAVKRADVEALRALDDRERSVVEDLHRRQGLRRQIMDAIGRLAGLPDGNGRSLTVSQLAAHLPADQRSVLLAAAAALGRRVARVVHANRLLGAVSRELLDHLTWVFEAVRPQDDRPDGYAGNGAPARGGETRILEVVG